MSPRIMVKVTRGAGFRACLHCSTYGFCLNASPPIRVVPPRLLLPDAGSFGDQPVGRVPSIHGIALHQQVAALVLAA
jgi:hypothetical protein